MKDQVDSLRELGIDARQVNSTTTEGEKREVVRAAREQRLRLLFVSPERPAVDRFQELLPTPEGRTLAIREAHLISHVGHDFRPEYRQPRYPPQKFPYQ